MYLYGDASWWDGWIRVSSYIDLGHYGKKRKNDKYSWVFGHNFASIGENASITRCVKDADPATW